MKCPVEDDLRREEVGYSTSVHSLLPHYKDWRGVRFPGQKEIVETRAWSSKRKESGNREEQESPGRGVREDLDIVRTEYPVKEPRVGLEPQWVLRGRRTRRWETFRELVQLRRKFCRECQYGREGREDGGGI